MRGMNNPILKVARPGLSALSADDKDLAFSSDWATPKIFMQTNSNWTNTLGYVPSFLGFRQLNSDVPTTFLSPFNSYYKNGGFTTSHYCHSVPSYMGDQIGSTGITFNYANNLLVSPFYDAYTGSWEDEDAFALLMLEPIDGTIPTSYTLAGGEVALIVGDGGDARTNFPSENAIDSRFDTFKIFQTGTLTMSLSSETINVGDGDSVYTESVEHNLGYPPVYLPEAGVGMRPRTQTTSGLGASSSFVVNDILGLGDAWEEEPILDVYVDSTHLYMRYRRQEQFSSTSYNAMTITLYYTIFYNEIGESFNYLNEDYQ
jgi:hypothetical protein